MIPWLFLVLQWSALLHEFHVSITEVNYANQELQCTQRVFVDDLEMRLSEDFGKALHIGTEQEIPEADSLIAAYLSENFKMQIEGKTLSLNYLGKEREVDMLYLHFFYPSMQKPYTIRLSNTVFFDSFEDQSNIVNLKFEGEIRSAFCTAAEPSHVLEY